MTQHLFRVKSIEHRIDGIETTLSNGLHYNGRYPVRLVRLVPDDSEFRGEEAQGKFEEPYIRGVYLEVGEIVLRLTDEREWNRFALDEAVTLDINPSGFRNELFDLGYSFVNRGYEKPTGS